jgi:hypothetical protein
VGTSNLNGASRRYTNGRENEQVKLMEKEKEQITWMELARGTLMEEDKEQVVWMVLVGVKQMKETRNKI